MTGKRLAIAQRLLIIYQHAREMPNELDERNEREQEVIEDLAGIESLAAAAFTLLTGKHPCNIRMQDLSKKWTQPCEQQPS